MKNNPHFEAIKKHINSTTLASIILGLSFITGLIIYGQKSTTDEIVTITGSAKESVISNLATYNLTFDKSYPASTGLQKIIEDFDKKTSALVGAIKYRGIPVENIKT
ncbi:hypothetical protein H6768_05630 [Candidatus Peribacteria bacterium]|nr:hypothetical protein [Candidatus Peribacteria bacterium]